MAFGIIYVLPSLFFFGSSVLGSIDIYANLNAVEGCGSECKDNGVFKCLGHVANAAACEALCGNETSCDILTWSAGSGNCWTRTDGLWVPVVDNGATSGCDPGNRMSMFLLGVATIDNNNFNNNTVGIY